MMKFSMLLVVFLISCCSNVFGDTENIYIKVGDPSYDSIYYPTLPKNFEKTWSFTTDDNARISFHCKEFQISRRAVCKNEEILVDTGLSERQLCGSQFDIHIISKKNKMSIKLKTSNDDGYMNCLVQAVTGLDQDQYKNIESVEIDSSEFGVQKGIKSTTCPCGWANKKTFQNLARIVNGKEAGKYEFPWMAAIRRDGAQFCGGAIITEYHVLTAAHCTVNKHDIELEVLVGTNIRWAELEGQRIKVKKIVENKYDKSKGHIHDISILVLEEKINFSEKVGPICLSPEIPNLVNKYITVMGWGYMQQFRSDLSDYLRKTNVRVVDFNTCNYKFNRKFDTKSPSRICTWSFDKDSCMGDSGGPLVWLDPETNRYTQVALVSYGKGCNTPNPKVNTAVSYYYEWIREVVRDTSTGVATCTKIGKWTL
uniref:Venom S1 protease with CUB domain 8 n=1 Tax=Platymeris rhadamanthus TaxID=1134088 RepID=A0A6B9L564_PLARH|nr:venom S1 protease with CUB domain 8 [Platymeris rhadamanthus]